MYDNKERIVIQGCSNNFPWHVRDGNYHVEAMVICGRTSHRASLAIRTALECVYHLGGITLVKNIGPMKQEHIIPCRAICKIVFVPLTIWHRLLPLAVASTKSFFPRLPAANRRCVQAIPVHSVSLQHAHMHLRQ